MSRAEQSSQVPNDDQRRTIWKEELADELTLEDLVALQNIGMQMRGIYNPEEETVGFGILESRDESLAMTYMIAKRRLGEHMEPLPGITLALITTIDGEDGSAWEGYHSRVRQTFGLDI